MPVIPARLLLPSLLLAVSVLLSACGADEPADEPAVEDENDREDQRPDPDRGEDTNDSDDDSSEGETPDAGDGASSPDVGTDASTPPDASAPDAEQAPEPGERALEPCGGANGDCVAGLDCLNTGSDGEGFCVLPCDGASCDDVRGEPAICALGVQGEAEPRYCVPLCETAADCPAGISCKPVNESLSVCAP